MPQYLEEDAIEKSSYVIEVEWFDDDGDAVAPTSATWTLTDGLGNVINSRSTVSILSLSTLNYIVLSGNDLAMQSGESGRTQRICLIEALYNSDKGNDLALKDVGIFYVVDLVPVS
jgi:hypothetical protein